MISKNASNRIKGLVLVFLSCTSLSAIAQSYREILEKTRDAFQHSELMHIKMTVRVFDSRSSNAPLLIQSVDIMRNKMDYFYSFGDQEILVNEHYVLMVSNQAREIIISGRNTSGDMIDQFDFSGSLDSLFNIIGEPKYIGEEGTMRHFRLHRESGPISSVDIFTESATDHIRKVEYQYRHGQLVNIEILKYETSPIFSSATFSEQKYLERVNGQWQGVGKYKNFEVLTNM